MKTYTFYVEKEMPDGSYLITVPLYLLPDRGRPDPKVYEQLLQGNVSTVYAVLNIRTGRHAGAVLVEYTRLSPGRLGKLTCHVRGSEWIEVVFGQEAVDALHAATRETKMNGASVQAQVYVGLNLYQEEALARELKRHREETRKVLR